MPRTPSEATRFTSTHPHAQSKSPSSTIPLPSAPAPTNETPHQKVNRLREAARKAKLDQETTWDKVVLRGKVWADRAHRVTATSLIGASVVAIGFATISFGDMMIANRKKKQEWYTEQEAAYERALAQARVAEANGTLTSNLSLFLNHDRATQQAEAEKRNKLSLWQRSKNLLSSGLGMKGESLVEGADRRTPEQDPSEALHKRGREQARMVGAQDSVSLSEASPVPKPSTAEDSRIVESRAGPAGGPLDRLGDQTSSSVSHTAGSLLGRFRGN